MAKHKYTQLLCMAIIAAMLAATILFMAGESFGVTAAHSSPPYVEKLFDTNRVHTLDIVMDESDWQQMLENAQSEEYVLCDVVIDGEAVQNVAIRPKGNSSLRTIASSDSDRYSFKIEFDHYNGGQNFYGLDKLALNNIVQDNTYLKDYISYQMMNGFSAYAPLSSFIYITLNGEDWGLYLAVEAIEEAFAKRLFGSDYGEIYKPDTMDMNGGGSGGGRPMPEDWRNMPGAPGEEQDGENQDGEEQIDQTFPSQFQQTDDETFEFPQEGAFPGPGGGFGGMGGGNNDAVALLYTDDDYDSYSAIFDNAAFAPDDSDKTRLIRSLKQLSMGENIEDVVNTDEVLRYFVVHNFLLNFDSYTGSLLHNYYLYEKNGVLSMIGWDYNLAFGAFGMGGGRPGEKTDDSSDTNSTTKMVNFPIDTPVSGATMEDRPLLNQLLSNPIYLEQYHELFAQWLSEYFDSGLFEQMVDETVALIAPYVEKDPTAFCTYDEFITAQETLKEFSLLRVESIKDQLNGVIASTSQAQSETNNAGFIDASHLQLDSMGSNMGGGPNRGDNAQGQGENTMRQNRRNQQSGDNQTVSQSSEDPLTEDPSANSSDSGKENLEGNFNQLQETPTNFRQSDRENASSSEHEEQNMQPYIYLVGSIIVGIAGLLFALRFHKY